MEADANLCPSVKVVTRTTLILQTRKHNSVLLDFSLKVFFLAQSVQLSSVQFETGVRADSGAEKVASLVVLLGRDRVHSGGRWCVTSTAFCFGEGRNPFFAVTQSSPAGAFT